MTTGPAAKGRIVVVMGVTSSGKSTVGKLIADGLGAPFLDGDQFHPEANVAKMRAGTPLTDEDRWPWLDRLGAGLHDAAENSGRAVGACSALKRVYRERLAAAAEEPVLWVYLHGDRALIGRRMAARKHHFMPKSLLDSQFEALEPPSGDENAMTVAISDDPASMASRVVARVAAAEPRA